MNKRGESQEMLGIILAVFVALMVGLALFTASAQLVGDVTNTIDVDNESVTSINGTTLATLTQLSGKSVSSVVAFNSSGGASPVLLTSGNYTIFNNQVIDGVETALFNATAEGTIWSGAGAVSNWNVSYTYEPTTYISDGGGRAVANIIIIFFALAIGIIVFIAVAKNKDFDFIGKIGK